MAKEKNSYRSYGKKSLHCRYNLLFLAKINDIVVVIKRKVEHPLVLAYLFDAFVYLFSFEVYLTLATVRVLEQEAHWS